MMAMVDDYHEQKKVTTLQKPPKLNEKFCYELQSIQEDNTKKIEVTTHTCPNCHCQFSESCEEGSYFSGPEFNDKK